MPLEPETLSSAQAGTLLGSISGRAFDRLAAAEDWLHPLYFGNLKRWRVEDVRALKSVLDGRGRGPAKPPPQVEDEGED